MLQHPQDATTAMQRRVRAEDPDVGPDDYDEDEDEENEDDEDEEEEDGGEGGPKWYVRSPAGVAHPMHRGA